MCSAADPALECRRAGIGCVDCKTLLAKNLNRELEPFRARRAQIASKPEAGARTFTIDKDSGEIDGEQYTALPKSYVIQRVGTQPKKIALTFDDGPDPDWTPKILDILKEKHVPATFFIIGENAEAPGRYFNGLIDEVRLYRRALTAQEIRAIHDALGTSGRPR